jgi:hypothetical protein
MTDFDYLAETINVEKKKSGCICRWDDIPDPDDKLEDWDIRSGRYPKTIVRITYVVECGHENHSQKAKESKQRFIRFTDAGGVEEIFLIRPRAQ